MIRSGWPMMKWTALAMTATISGGISWALSTAAGACCRTGAAGAGAGVAAAGAGSGFFRNRDLMPLKKAQMMAATPMARSIQSNAEPLGHSDRARK